MMGRMFNLSQILRTRHKAEHEFVTFLEQENELLQEQREKAKLSKTAEKASLLAESSLWSNSSKNDEEFEIPRCERCNKRIRQVTYLPLLVQDCGECHAYSTPVKVFVSGRHTPIVVAVVSLPSRPQPTSQVAHIDVLCKLTLNMFCLAMQLEQFPCEKCRMTMYCSNECVKRDAINHKQKCKRQQLKHKHDTQHASAKSP